MLTRAIPSTGERLPVVGCGTWQAFDIGADEAESARQAAVLAALFAAGGSVIDTSPMYGQAEAAVGRLLRSPDLGGRGFIATKVWTRGREAGMAQMARSEALLGTRPLDLVQVHNLIDWRTHLDTLAAWKAEGRIRYVGISHYTDSAHADLEAVMRAKPVDFVQVNYALDDRAAERRLLPAAREHGVAVLINRPFGEGALLRRLRGPPLPAFAADLGCGSWAELALKYLLANEAVTCVIPATRSADHMAANARAGSGPLPDNDLRRRILAAAGL